MSEMKMISSRCSCAFLTITIVFLSMSVVYAHDGPDHDKQYDLAKASQNPISSLVSVPFEFNNT